MLSELLLIAVLTMLNGVLAMSELAVVSSRPARLKVLSQQRISGAAAALALHENPGRFLSSVQIGITLVGVLSGALSGATLGHRLTLQLLEWGWSETLAEAVGVGSVVVAITYASLIIGELVPKQIALRDPERVAARVAPAMTWLSRIASPLVSLLDLSGRAVLALLGQKSGSDETVTDEEVRTVIAEAASAGVLEPEEREMISGVMRLADRSVRGLMTPRRDAEILDLADNPAKLRAQVRATHRSRLLVQDGEADAIMGVVHVKDLVDWLVDGQAKELRELVQSAPVVMDTAGALDALRVLRGARVQVALVFDEYGHFEGLVTPADVLEAITGAVQDDINDEPAVVPRADGSFLVSGWMPADEFADQFSVPVSRDSYQTVAGFMLAEFNRLPQVGEAFEKEQWRFEVVDLDGLRIDKILVAPAGEQAAA